MSPLNLLWSQFPQVPWNTFVSSLFISFVALLETQSRYSISFSYWWAQKCTQYFRCCITSHTSHFISSQTQVVIQSSLLITFQIISLCFWFRTHRFIFCNRFNIGFIFFFPVDYPSHPTLKLGKNVHFFILFISPWSLKPHSLIPSP